MWFAKNQVNDQKSLVKSSESFSSFPKTSFTFIYPDCLLTGASTCAEGKCDFCRSFSHQGSPKMNRSSAKLRFLWNF